MGIRTKRGKGRSRRESKQIKPSYKTLLRQWIGRGEVNWKERNPRKIKTTFMWGSEGFAVEAFSRWVSLSEKRLNLARRTDGQVNSGIVRSGHEVALLPVCTVKSFPRR